MSKSNKNQPTQEQSSELRELLKEANENYGVIITPKEVKTKKRKKIVKNE
jgi:hypothetical protein